MTAQVLDRTLTCYRIGDPNGRFPIFDATGSTIAPGRWNTPASPVIYAAEHFATAMLEKLVHGSGQIPKNQHSITITIPKGASYEVVTAAGLKDWDAVPPVASKIFGEDWCQARRSLILIVPCVVARVERNVLINPGHPEFRDVETSLHEPVLWDGRLFATDP
ncbi:RES family NAD+ phosphorylase [Defluviimonas salinarum]|uniref:RES family NAD+ phosphorylase n=1 Tax=Defluviimonas salinarum TaxID=2992147 RepID=A0ABT3J7H8_9RHOB|nr:RES family NAD+ phosphorylase [Defluviimonas salinarum]MCW3783600.1 RES family NAD+ phosphorylase [Defluviimonas salinarum]